MKALKNTFINIRRSPYQSLLVILMMTLTFTIGYAVSFATHAANQLLSEVESQPQVVAFFKLDTPKATQETVKKQLQDLSYTKNVTLITQEEALKLYKEENQDEPLLLELVTADILPASVEVSTYKIEDLKKIKSELDRIESIDDVIYQQEVIDSLAKAIGTVKLIGLGAVAILTTISFITMVVIIALKVAGKKHSIKVMKLVGAGGGFIRRPYVLEGAVYGLVGSIVGFGLNAAAIHWLWPQVLDGLNLNINIGFDPWLQLTYFMVGTTLGIMLGGFAGLVAVNRLIKR